MTLIERLLTLLNIPSITTQEKQLCDFLVQQFSRRNDYKLTRIGNSFSLYPLVRREFPLVVLVGHLDTVPLRGENPVRQEKGRIFGLGASDMKSGLALMWHLIEKPLVNPAYDLAFIFYDKEEGSYDDNGLSPLLKELPWINEIDLAVLLEPSKNVLQLGCVGSIHAEVTFRGKAAHSARPWLGENAIYKARELLEKLANREPVEVRVGDLLYKEVLLATIARGGDVRNVVPEKFMLNLNYRFAPGRSSESAQNEILELVGNQADVQFVDIALPGSIPQDNKVLSDFCRKGFLSVEAKQGWTDVARLAQAGIPSVNLGPGENEQAHKANESISIDLLHQGEDLFRRILSID